MNPKVLVGGPVSDMHGYCFDEFVESRKKLTYPNHDLFFVDNSKDKSFAQKVKNAGLPVTRIPWEEKARLRMINSRNLLRKKVLDEGYDYFLNLDQDIIPPDDIIEKLIRHKKEIVTGIYFNPLETKTGEHKLRSVVGISVNGKVRFLTEKELSEGKLMRVDICGTGCILIHRKVFEDIKFRYKPDELGFDDFWLVHDAYEKGFQVYADTSVICRHLILERPWHWGELLKKNIL